MRKKRSALLAAALVFSMAMQSISVSAASVRTIDIPDYVKPVVSQSVSLGNLAESTGELSAKINFVYPEKTDTISSRNIQMELFSGNTSMAKFNVTRDNLNKDGQFTDQGKTYTYSLKALNEQGVPITTELNISYIDLNINNLPLGKYSIEFTGNGYTKYRTQEAELLKYSKQFVVSTDDGRFMLGDVDGNNKIEVNDRMLVEKHLSTKGDGFEAADLNKDGKCDLVDLALVNRNINARRAAAQEIFDTAMIVSQSTDLNEVKESLKGKKVQGDISSMFSADGNAVTIGQEAAISKTNPILIPVAFNQATEISEIKINMPHTVQITGGYVLAEVEEDGGGTTIEYPIENSQPADVHAIGTTEGVNAVVIQLGKKVAVKKITICVEKVTNTDGSEKYVSISEIKFIKDIVPENPKSDNGTVQDVTIKNGSGQVALSWKKVANITGYRVYVSNKPGNVPADYEEAATVDTAAAVIKTFHAKKLENYDKYYFRITSINGEWESKMSEEVTGEPVPNSKPLRPDNVKAEETDGGLLVTWKKTADAMKYNLYYKKTADRQYSRIENIYNPSHALGRLENDIQYDVYVTAVNPVGESVPSLVSQAIPHKLKVKDPGIPRKNIIDSKHITQISMVYPNNVKKEEYPNGFDLNNIVDGDFATHWTARIWWESSGFNITFDEAREMNFLTYVTRLDGNYKNSLSTYKITVWEDGDDLTKPGKLIVENGKVTMIASKEENNTGKYAVLTFPKTNVRKITVETKVWDGAPTWASMSELCFYDYYDLVDNIEDLFGNNTFTALKPDTTQKKIDDIRALLNAEDSYYVDSEILAGELDLAESLLPGNTSEAGLVKAGIESMDGFQPLGVSGLTGNEFLVYADIPAGETLELVATQYFAEAGSWMGKSIKISEGRNIIQIPQLQTIQGEKGGSLYLKYMGNAASQIKLHIKEYSPATLKNKPVRYIPVLELYRWPDMTEEERKAEIKRYMDELAAYTATINQGETAVRNTTEISMPNVLLSLPASTVLLGIMEGNTTEQDKIQSVYQNVLAWNELMHIVYTTNGVGEAEISKQKRENIRYMRMFGKAFMYAAGSHVGVGYGSTKALMMGRPTDTTGPEQANALFGWGIAHEIGHNKDTLGYAEITNNIYSLFAQVEDGAENAMISRVPFDEVFQKTAKGVGGMSNNVFVQLGMYWQLHLAYDGVYRSQEDNFYYKVNNLYRQGIGSQYGKNDRFAVAASQASGINLTDYFTRWGMKLSPEAIVEMSRYGVEDRAIYYLNDASRKARIHGDPNQQPVNITANAVMENQNSVAVTWEHDGSANQLQGFEILRNEKPVAFVTQEEAAENGNRYLDVLGSANNLSYHYAVRVIDLQGYFTGEGRTGEVKISHDVVIPRENWTSTTKDGIIKVSMNTPQSIAGIRFRDFTSAVTPGAITIEARLKNSPESTQVVKVIDFSTNDSESQDTFINYFNKPDTDPSDTRIWTYDVQELIITGLPESIPMSSVDFIEYPGDNIDIAESQIGLMGEDYVFDETAGENGIIKKGTLVITGHYRGDPVYNIISLKGQFDNSDSDPDKAQVITERNMSGYALLFAEIPENGEVSEISDGFWIFVPDIQKEAELQNQDACATSVLPVKIKAELWRTDTPESTDDKRLASDTLWIASPGYETMPEIYIK